MATFISRSPDETIGLGEQWGREAQAGWVIALTGDLGAGKTHLVKGIARGLGVSDRVQSPTFALVNEYAGGRLPLFHLDLYRLDTREQIARAGLEEFLYPKAGVAVVEWGERWFAGCAGAGGGQSSTAKRFRWVVIEVTGENERRFIYEDSGA
jgi:tRNA threonylcarbamoyladenosine biosynthesis protein TsaE